MPQDNEALISSIAKAMKCNPEDVRAISESGEAASIVTATDAYKVSIGADNSITRIVPEGADQYAVQTQVHPKAAKAK